MNVREQARQDLNDWFERRIKSDIAQVADRLRALGWEYADEVAEAIVMVSLESMARRNFKAPSPGMMIIDDPQYGSDPST